MDWPGADLAIVAFAVLFLAVSGAAVVMLRRPRSRGLAMNTMVNVLRELMGLFVDDGALALAIVAIVVLAAVVAALMPDLPLAAGVVLPVGCLRALLLNVISAGRR